MLFSLKQTVALPLPLQRVETGLLLSRAPGTSRLISTKEAQSFGQGRLVQRDRSKPLTAGASKQDEPSPELQEQNSSWPDAVEALRQFAKDHLDDIKLTRSHHIYLDSGQELFAKVCRSTTFAEHEEKMIKELPLSFQKELLPAYYGRVQVLCSAINSCDFKPEHFFLDPDTGRIVIIDWDQASLRGQQHPLDAAFDNTWLGSFPNAVSAGSFRGTLRWASINQHLGYLASSASDLESLMTSILHLLGVHLPWRLLCKRLSGASDGQDHHGFFVLVSGLGVKTLGSTHPAAQRLGRDAGQVALFGLVPMDADRFQTALKQNPKACIDSTWQQTEDQVPGLQEAKRFWALHEQQQDAEIRELAKKGLGVGAELLDMRLGSQLVRLKDEDAAADSAALRDQNPDSWTVIGEVACYVNPRQYPVRIGRLERAIVHREGGNAGLNQDAYELHPLQLCQAKVFAVFVQGGSDSRALAYASASWGKGSLIMPHLRVLAGLERLVWDASALPL
ncbi:hypothetical protein WJX73_006599 [Symbiochloris irregularis]|uniref:Protein kinase domain-containing protein n=1 Tax=Symbiochloris irregularis TaxID=706552 RepID=A0AAW1P2J9_9CHLO